MLLIKKRLSLINKTQLIKDICLRTSLALMIFLSACGQSSAYDASKAPSLSEERRRELDILLANEMETYNTNTERCKIDLNKPSAPFICRVAFFKQLAAEGYEVADIVDKIFNPLKGVIKKDRAAYERLRELADAGDKSALCFAPRIYMWFLYDSGWPYTLETEMKYNQKGVKQGLPLCLLNESNYYSEGLNGFPKDLKMAHQRAIEGASAGLYFGQLLLFIEYQELLGTYEPEYQYKDSDLPTIRKALCWGRLAGHHSVAAGLRTFTGYLSTKSRDKEGQIVHPELEQLAIDWDIGFTPYEQKPTTPTECLKIEEEN